MLTKSNAELTETTIKLTRIISDLTGQLKRAQVNTPSGGREKNKRSRTNIVPTAKWTGSTNQAIASN